MEEIEGQIIAVEGAGQLVETSRSTDQVLALKRAVDRIKKEVMQPDVHYGRFSGIKKDMLYQEGADVLNLTFRLAVSYIMENLSHDDVIHYRHRCVLTYIPTGEVMGEAEGECSSEEEKYKWRYSVSNEEWDATPEDQRRIKYTKNGSFRQVRSNPFDLSNTILQMSQKRAKTSATKSTLAAGDLFTIEVDHENIPDEEPRVSEPKRKSEKKKTTKKKKKTKEEAPPKEDPPEPEADDDDTMRGCITDARIVKQGEKNGRPWTLYGVTMEEDKFTTFDKHIYETASEALAEGSMCQGRYEQDGQYMKITALQITGVDGEEDVPF